MADERIIRALRAEAALDSTYSRGLKIARSGAVLALAKRAGDIGSTVALNGRVRGSDGAYYATTVDLDTQAAEVLDYSCTCPAASRYPGMCKHEIALALSFLGEKDTPPAEDSRPAAAASPMPAPAPMPRTPAPKTRPWEAPTSQGLSDLLERSARLRLGVATVHRARSVARQEVARLEPTLVVPRLSDASSAFMLKLAVCRGSARYVVKSVSDFVRLCREGRELAYGKSLALVHVRDSFDERSWALTQVVSRIVREQASVLAARGGMAGSLSAGVGRTLTLSDADLVTVLDALQGTAVLTESSWGGSYFSAAGDDLEVTRSNPRPAATIKASNAGGYDVSVNPELRVVCADEACYVIDAARACRTDADFSREAAPVLAALSQPAGATHVNSRDVGEFCRTVLPVLRQWCDLTAPDDLDAMVPPEPAFLFRIGEDDGYVTCGADVAYGEWRCVPGAPEASGQPQRDLASEYHVCDVLDDYFPLGGMDTAGPEYRFGEDDEDLLFRLLTDGLSELAGLGEVRLSERLRAIHVRPAPALSVRATVESDLLNVELGASGLSHEELLEYLDGFKRRQRFVRLSSGDIVRLGNNLKVAQELAYGLGVSVDALTSGRLGLPSARSLLIDALLQKAEGVRLERDAGFRQIIRDFEGFGEADIDVPSGLHATLRGYQEDGFRWLGTLERLGFGGILADDMGLGKTLQVIAHILARKEAGEKGVTLVVCPASLVYNWMSEVARFAPALDAVAVVGAKAARRQAISAVDGHDLLVTSYDLLRRDVEDYADVRFSRVVLDEAQYIKNPKAQVTRAAKCLDARVRFALTGTPIENRLAELWSIFDFLMPGYLGTRDQFAKRYEGPIEAGEHDGQRLLQCAIGPFVLRRLKSEVLADLPEKAESVVVAQMGTKQKKLYLASQDRLALQVQHMVRKNDPSGLGREKLKVLAELTRLRQICCDPRLCVEGWADGSAKLDTCMELVGQAVDAGHKVLLFSQFTSMLELVAARLADAHLRYFTLTGATSKEDRERLVHRFQAGEADVFLISLKAGGVGLNLTAADVVIHYDPWWNVAAQDQATDRAHRIGQRRDVSVIKLICEGTIEERILKMQESKRSLAESVLGSEAVRSSTLTRDDVLALLGQAGIE